MKSVGIPGLIAILKDAATLAAGAAEDRILRCDNGTKGRRGDGGEEDGRQQRSKGKEREEGEGMEERRKSHSKKRRKKGVGERPFEAPSLSSVPVCFS